MSYLRIFSFLLFGFLFAGCQTIPTKAPKVELKRIDVLSVENGKINLLLVFFVQNPNKAKLRVESIEYEVFHQDRSLVKDKFAKALEVDGKADRIVEFPVPVNFKEAITAGISFLLKRELPYRLEGRAQSGVFSVPFHHEGKLKL